MENNEKRSLSDRDFSDDDIKKLFTGQDKGLVRLFIDTLSFAVQRISAMLKQTDDSTAKVKIMMELDKIYQSSKYLGIVAVSDLIAAVKDKISIEASDGTDDILLLNNVLQQDLLILKKIIAYWNEPAESSSAKRLNEERKILLQFSKEDDELQQLYIDLLTEYLKEIYDIIIKMQNKQILGAHRENLSELLLRLDTSTSFMNYPELSELIREGLIAVEDYKNENVNLWLKGIGRVYNLLIDNVRVQFSGSKGIQESCKKIDLL